MKKRQQFIASFMSTRVDLHGEHFTKKFLNTVLAQFRKSGEPSMLDLDHQTTLPPLGYFHPTKVQKADDGAYELVGEGELFADEDYIEYDESKIKEFNNGGNNSVEGLPLFSLEVGYDPINFSSEEIRPVIESLNEIIPTSEKIISRKAEIPVEVIWILVGGISAGFVGRLGEILADKTVDAVHSILNRIYNVFTRFLNLRPSHRINIIFGIPIDDSEIILEGAVENADEAILAKAWISLPLLNLKAKEIIRANPKNYFRDIKFIFNPVSSKWEINYLTTRKLEHVILGPRYYDAKHPLACRIEDMRQRARGMRYVSVSFGGYREEK